MTADPFGTVRAPNLTDREYLAEKSTTELENLRDRITASIGELRRLRDALDEVLDPRLESEQP